MSLLFIQVYFVIIFKNSISSLLACAWDFFYYLPSILIIDLDHADFREIVKLDEWNYLTSRKCFKMVTTIVALMAYKVANNSTSKFSI